MTRLPEEHAGEDPLGSRVPDAAPGPRPVELPEDPDTVETTRTAPNAVHLRPAFLGLVFAGGTLGTAARAALANAFPPVNGVPYAVLAINLSGALLLGALIEQLAMRGPDDGRRRVLRLLLGTGFLGGFTTYSSLATDSAVLLRDGAAASGIGYALATVVVGAIATVAGMALARRTRSTRAGSSA